MKLTLTHVLGDRVEVRHGQQLLFTYHYDPQFDPYESRKPYVYPLHTLKGNGLAIYRPHDHLWHKGIQMTCANLSGENFWGGATFVKGKGYVKLDNVGRQQHLTWDQLECDGKTCELEHQLLWITQAGENWIHEHRKMRVGEVNEKDGYWSIDWTFRFRNISEKTLKFGSPTTAGRENAGYGGLFWRGPRDFTNGKLLAEGALEGPGVMGKRSRWIAFVGRHDGTGDRSTVLFADREGNASYPTKWFARTTEFAAIATAFSFDEEVAVEPGKELALNYRTVFADGEWRRERCEAMAG